MPTYHRHRLHRAAAGIAVAVALVSTAGAGTATASPAPPPLPARAMLTDALDRLVATSAPGATVLVRDGERTVQAARGYANLETKTPMSGAQRTRVGSLTKTFVATLVLQLDREHKLALDDPVERWLPGLVPGGQQITIRHLLSHRAGLPEFYGDPAVMQPYVDGNFAHAWRPEDLVRHATSHEPLFAPGTNWSYSNTNYVVLGLIAEAASGHSIASALDQRIFRPLGLTRTSFSTSPRIGGSHARGYYSPENGPLTDVTGIQPFPWTAGAVVSTPADIARFYRALLQKQLLSNDQMRTMQTTVPGYPGTRSGLGLFSRRTPCGPAWGHQGTTPGYMSRAWSSESGRRQVVVTVNIDPDSLSAAGNRALETLITKAYCG
jgi:D-alanyl-D-alanine carboxypeptidase